MPVVRTNDIETYYVTRGDGPPIVFVHGMIMSNTMWEPQMDALSDAFTTIAYDVRGHGRTGGSQKPMYSIDLFAEDLDALLKALEIDRAVICGLSMGGTIAQAFAAPTPRRWPDSCSRIRSPLARCPSLVDPPWRTFGFSRG